MRIISSVSLLGLLLLQFAPKALSAKTDDLGLGQLLPKYIKATGGVARLSSVSSLRIDAENISENGTVTQFTVYKKRDNKIKAVAISSDGSRTIQAFDGQEAWMLFESEKNTSFKWMSEAEKFALVRDALIESPIVDPKAAGVEVEYQGVDSSSTTGQKFYKILVSYPNGSTTTYYIDSNTYVERRIVMTDALAEPPTTTEIIPSDYQMVDGLNVAHRSIQRDSGGGRSEFVVKNVVVNPGIFDEVFQVPPDVKKALEQSQSNVLSEPASEPGS